MLSYLRKRWNYLLAKLNLRHEETADPKVQLEQAISEAKDQHRRLREQAANVVANQKQTEMRINDALAKLEKTNANARQAVLMAEEAATEAMPRRSISTRRPPSSSPTVSSFWRRRSRA